LPIVGIKMAKTDNNWNAFISYYLKCEKNAIDGVLYAKKCSLRGTALALFEILVQT
jgi:hypothetical protein